MKRKLHYLSWLFLFFIAFDSSAQYCVFEGTNSTYYINSFSTTGGLNGNNISNLNSGYSAGGYSNQTASAVHCLSGTSFAFTAGFPTGQTYGVNIWIDFNNNQTFDASELVYASGAYVGTASGNIAVPASTQAGSYRMRIVGHYFSTNPSSCGSIAYGEAEDYTVTVTVPTCPQPINLGVLQASDVDADLSWTTNSTATEWRLIYGVNGFNPASAGTQLLVDQNPYNLTNLTPNTIYQYYVRGLCSATDSSALAGPFTFNTYNFGQVMEWNTDCPAGGFVDIASTGTNLNLTDDSEANVNLPFDFYYQGQVFNVVRVGNNGGLLFQSTGEVPTVVNFATSPNGLFPWVDDLDDETGDVFWSVTGTAPNRKFIVQWDNICNFSGTTSSPTVTFELIMDEATMEIYFVYDDVVFGTTNEADDYGANADIGIAGPSQDLIVSVNNPTFLTNNSCAHFYYTDCPRPQNIQFTNVLNDEVTVTWSAGLYAGNEWTVEYGDEGFTPGTGTVVTPVNTTSLTIPNLTQLTQYDVYVYSACSSTDSSAASFGSVLTAPVCANPTAVAATSLSDTLKVTWNWSQTLEPISSFNITYGNTGFELYGEGTEVVADGINFADTIADLDLMAGVTYQVYVQAVCPSDTSSYVGPFSIKMPVTNDSVCLPEMLMVDGTRYNFSVNNDATVSNSVTPTESSIAPPANGYQTTNGWGTSTINRSTWFTFVAPASGSMRIDGTDTGYDGKIAVYEVGQCGDFGTFDLLGANDDDIDGSSFAPNFTLCGLTPGQTYYLMHSSAFSATNFNYSIRLSEIVLQAGNAEPITNICYGDTINLYETINGNDIGGVWIPTIGNVQLVQDSLFASTGLAYQTFGFQYRMTDGCAYDSIVSQVKIFAPSTAGEDGGFTVCRNEHFDLLQGLGGLIQAGGTWYDPANNPLPNSQVIASNFPGQYNYDYIAGNGVCPDDTALVIVNVNGACDFLGVELLDANSIEIYPNPTEGIIQINNNRNENFSIVVTDLNGRVVYTDLNSILAGNQTVIDLSNVETGVYLIKIFNSYSERVERILIK